MSQFNDQPTTYGGWADMDLDRARSDAARLSSSIVRAALLRQIEAEEQRRAAGATVVQRSCSWCDTLNGTNVQLCRKCGHEAYQPRMLCGCSRCRPTTTTTR